MTATITALAILCYIGGAILQYFRLRTPSESKTTVVTALGAAAVLLHALSFNNTLLLPQGLDLSFYQAGSLVCWLVVLLTLLSSLKKSIHSLLVGLFPIAALSLLAATLCGEDSQRLQAYELSSTGHILLSITAFSLLTVAALQALLLAYQDYHLRHIRANAIIQNLPPLQAMEQLLFEWIWVGLGLLTAAIVSGFLFIDDLFEQHLAHKTLLSIVAWVIFSILIGGRYLLGWRGTTAIRWTLGGYALLLLAYFGTKLVLEIILHRV